MVPLLKEIFPGNSLNVELSGTEEGFRNGQNMDLRKRDALLKNTESQNWDYGGWWYCCIPVSAIRERVFCCLVFIHRDDIEYGIVWVS